MASVAEARKAPNVPLLPRVQGIRSHFSDLILRGDRFVDRLDGAFIDGTLIRKIGGASEVKIEVQDKGAKLLNSPLLEEKHVVSLDGLAFAYVAFERAGLEQPLSLTYEAQLANRLRQLSGPHKAFRDEMTRAEFARARVFDLKPPRPRFVCPELHKIQPVKSIREGRQAAEDAKQRRGKGIGSVELKVKGNRADSTQVALGDRALRVAEAENAESRVMIALMEALIIESEIGRSSGNYLQLVGSTARAKGIDPNSLEQSVRGFLLGYYPGQEGAIEYFHKHPNAKAYEIAQAVQASGAGAGSNGAGNYGTVADEAAEWVSAYGGGAEVTEMLRFPWEEKENENHWKFLTDLAKPVNWRFFESAGWIYFIAEPTLFKSHTRLSISDSTPGVLDTQVKGDEGKPREQVTVEAMARMWSAPPGSVVSLTRHGPADGLYLVERIESPLAKRDALCTITLKRPTKPKKEPAPPTRSRSLSTGGSLAPDNAPVAIEKMIAEIEATTGTFHYKWGGGHESVDALHKRLKGWDCSGYVSHILWVGGLLDSPETSGTLAGMFEAGVGDFLTIYANDTHVFAKILTSSGWRYFQSGGGDNSTGWVSSGKQDSTAGYSARHPAGL